MTATSSFSPRYDELPASLPIFPLAGVLLLPRGRLPLNIFEPRYLNMIRDALAGERMIGMVQPMTEGIAAGTSPPGTSPAGTSPVGAPAVYATGCAGRITSFSETDDGRFLVTLTGVARFEIREEVPTTRGYRRIVPSWQRFRADLAAAEAAAIDRPRLVQALRAFFKLHGLTADWDTIKATADERLITSLAMICPFAPNEKQALLEAPDLAERSRVMIALVEMGALKRAPDDSAARH